MSNDYQILLFYKYTRIDDPYEEKVKQVNLCEKLNLTCRTIIANEGINGTLEGTIESTETYIEEMKKDDRFADIHWKRSPGTGDAFPRVSVKVRNEIVSLSLTPEDDVDPNIVTGKYITADELHKLYESDEEFYVIDMRNDYEMKVGHFKDAILMPMSNFRELPEKFETLESIKHKKIITTCTGGIRCEKASGFLVKQGFTDVYQLYGGMHTYIEKYPNKHFLGSLYVFDGRIIVNSKENQEEHEIVGTCEKCNTPSELYVDCAYLHCAGRRHFITCQNCLDENGFAFCSSDCKEKAYDSEKFTKIRHEVKVAE